MRYFLLNRCWCFSLFLLLLTGGSIAWYAYAQEANYRHLYVVKPGVLYRSGQLTPKSLARVIYENNIGTVVNLRSPDAHKTDKSDSWEEELCFKSFVRFVSIPFRPAEHPKNLSMAESHEIIEGAAERFLEILSDPVSYPQPILVHCLAGVHRTGLMVALFRMEKDGWSKDQAIEEMQQRGFVPFKSDDPLCQFIVHWTPTRERKVVSEQTK
ncbi:MAG TPA: tyrosine-protein phosphatase [Gemmatales bacterium]|nr:tyrosine-protein phosphatase [Gemmatales bacterium]